MSAETKTPGSYLAYRPDIDGLRAVAVGGVLLFHAFPRLVTGGFVGVDVFFVISGFLITQIVRRGTQRRDFSISEFYERRIRRIFPALAVVVVATSIIGLIILPPEDLKTYGRSLPPAVAFAANFHFWTRGSYFNPPADVRPLLHLWSLGVEEQFYLVWPWLLVLAGRRSAKVVGMGLLILAAISLAGDEIYVHKDPLAAFYAPWWRAWEPLIGALLAVGWLPPIRDARLREFAGAVGLAAIVGSMTLLSEAAPFPGLAALPACLGAALLLHGGAGEAPTRTARALSARPVVWLGAASYSLYLCTGRS